MRSIARTLSELGGIAPTYELNAHGHSLDVLYGAVQRGEILRPRKGWYASKNLPPEAIRACRVGGRLACLSATGSAGLWMPDDDKLHIEVPITASRLRAPNDHRVRLSAVHAPGTVIHWTSTSSPGTRISVSPGAAVRQVFDCCGDEAGFLVLESALNKGRLAQGDLGDLLAALPDHSRRLAMRAGRLSDSGGESELKLLLFRLGIPFRQQVVLAGKWRVDFLLGKHLVLEADSREHHSDPYRDRKKDAELSAVGVRVLRFMYSQIHYEPSAVELAIVSALSRGDADFA
ncbi:MAG TPA: DUF559 domain-containing protein [Galbitalea sp.]|jgi:very-short-patch-repair endonuclease|nr:DUF559 domain-containing protein [Galbitalea sp.]